MTLSDCQELFRQYVFHPTDSYLDIEFDQQSSVFVQRLLDAGVVEVHPIDHSKVRLINFALEEDEREEEKNARLEEEREVSGTPSQPE